MSILPAEGSALILVWLRRSRWCIKTDRLLGQHLTRWVFVEHYFLKCRHLASLKFGHKEVNSLLFVFVWGLRSNRGHEVSLEALEIFLTKKTVNKDQANKGYQNSAVFAFLWESFVLPRILSGNSKNFRTVILSRQNKTHSRNIP